MILFFLFSSVIIKIPFEVKHDIRRVEFQYSHDKNKWYTIGVNKYSYPSFQRKDTFTWKVKEAPEENDEVKNIRVVYSSNDDVIIKNVNNFTIKEEKDRKEYIYNGRKTRIQDTDTSYSWRMLGYNAHHTGYYPHPIYPPLELKWEYGRGVDGSPDYTMVSSSAGNDMLYTRKGSEGVYGINWIAAVDIETGEEIWSRELTSNVMTTALSPDDSLLFVGTSIGWDTLYPTFYCMNPFNGEIKWSKFLHTVEFSPIVVDTIVYAPNLYGGTLTAMSFTGDILFQRRGGFHQTPAYYNNKIYGGDQNCALISIDAYTGDTLWVYSIENDMMTHPIIFNSKVFISCNFYETGGVWKGGLYALDCETGEVLWKKEREREKLSGVGFKIAHNGNVYGSKGYWIVVDSLIGSYAECFNADSGDILWGNDIYFGETNSPTWVITKNGIIWMTPQWIYGLNVINGNIEYTGDTLENVNYYQYARFFPILYKNYLIRGYRTRLYLYEGEVAPPDTLDEESLISIPNPFFNSVRIIGKTDNYILSIYNLMGRKVKVIKGTPDIYGYMNFYWDGKDEKGEFCSQGVYILKAGDLRGKTVYLKRR